MSQPLISILMNCYNGEHYLREALDSVLAQTYGNWELIFWDNQSTDNSADIFKQYKDARFKYFWSPEHTNLGGARPRAFEQLAGEFVAVLDVDDVWLPEKLETQIQFLEGLDTAHQPLVLMGTWCRYIDETGRVINRAMSPTGMTDICNAIVWGNPFANSSVLFRRQAALEQGGYNEQFTFANDLDLWLRLMLIGEAAIVPAFLTDIRVLSTSITRSSQHRLNIAYEELTLYQRAIQQFEVNAPAQAANRKAMARHGVTYGQSLLQTGHLREGIRWISWGLGQDPWVLLREKLRPFKQLLKST